MLNLPPRSIDWYATRGFKGPRGCGCFGRLYMEDGRYLEIVQMSRPVLSGSRAAGM